MRAQVLLLRSRPRGTFYVKCVPFSGLQVVPRGGAENVILLGMALYNHGSRDLFKKKEEEREIKRNKKIIFSRHCFLRSMLKLNKLIAVVNSCRFENHCDIYGVLLFFSFRKEQYFFLSDVETDILLQNKKCYVNNGLLKFLC